MRNISMSVIRRLPKYHRYLRDMINNGIDRTSSRELSDIMGFSASQIRQDFNHFGEFGQQGYGYNVRHLYDEISKIIGLNRSYSMIILGVGNIGTALSMYNFGNYGFELKAIFDNDVSKIGRNINGREIMSMSNLEKYVAKNPIDIALLCVPAKVAQGVADRLIISGVRSIWNFTSVDLVGPDNYIIENIHLVDSLMTMTYLLNEE